MGGRGCQWVGSFRVPHTLKRPGMEVEKGKKDGGKTSGL